MEIIFKIHARCNLSCTYCYMYNMGDDSYLQMPNRVSIDVVRALVEMIEGHAEKTGRMGYSVVFHGGEPLLVGKTHFRKIMEEFARLKGGARVEFGLQTNAILIDDEWVNLFREFGVSLSASIDGPEEMNSRRVDHQGNPRTKEIEAGIIRLRDAELLGGALAVLSPEADGRTLVQYFRDVIRVPVFNLLLPDHSHDCLPVDWEQQQEKIGRVLTDGFDEWLSGLHPMDALERVMPHVPLFVHFVQALDDLIKERGFRPALKERPTVVVETNGDLDIHDVMRIHSGYKKEEGLKAGRDAISSLYRTSQFLNALNPAGEFAPQCLECRFFNSCGGGFFFHRYSASNGYANPSVHCRALTTFQNHVLAAMSKPRFKGSVL